MSFNALHLGHFLLVTEGSSYLLDRLYQRRAEAYGRYPPLL